MNKQEFLAKYGLTEDQFCGKEEIKGSIDLRSVTTLPEGFNPTVGGSIYLRSVTTKYSFQKMDTDAYLFSWQDGKYISVDGMFCEVISSKKNIFKCKKINQTDEFYIVGDGNGKFAHGKTVKEAKSDLVYKISNRDTSKYIHLTKDSVITFEEAIECYRIITGACAFGTKSFVESSLTSIKKTYSIGEIGKLTNGQYGNSAFVKFFNL